MRVLAVADYYQHGASRVVEERAALLARRGHRVVVLAGAGPEGIPEQEEALRRQGLDPVLFPYRPGPRGPRSLFLLRRAFRSALESCRLRPDFDAILLNQPLSAWAVLGSPHARGAAALYTFHSPWAEEWAIARGLDPERPAAGLRARLELAARGWIESWALARSDRIAVLSEFMRRQLARAHPRVPEEAVARIPGGVDLRRFRPADPAHRRARREALGVPPEGSLLLTVRRLVPRMGIENLLLAFGALAGRFPRLHLVVGGAGPLEHKLRAECSRLGVSGRVRFLGFVPETDLPGLYQAADLFVLPTARLEGFGLATIEALSSGTPVVGTPVGATPEILAPLDPRLVARDATAAGLAAAIGGILRLPAAEREALRDGARRRAAEHYGAEEVGDRLEQAILELVEARRARRFRPRAGVPPARGRVPVAK